MNAVDREVRQMLDEYFKTVEQRDLRAFLGYFDKGDDLTVFEDKEMYDWKGFVAFAESFFQQVKQIGVRLERCAVNPLAARVAVVTGIFSVTGKTTDGSALAIRNCFTFVLSRRESRWLIDHVHESSL